MKTTPIIHPSQFGLRIATRLRALLAVSVLATLAVPNSAIAQPGVPNQFAATGLSDPAVPPPRPIPAYSQTVNVGTQFSVNIVMAIGSRPGGVYGVDAQLRYNPTQLQVVSVTTAPSSPWTNPIPGIVTGFNNTLGTLQYAAQGGAVGGNVSVATIVFTAIAAGTSNLYYQDVVPYYTGFGRYGSNGLSIGGSVTVNAPLPTQTLTILGGSGSAGGVAANVEFYNPATLNWQPAYLAQFYNQWGQPISAHPWGHVQGTNQWINYRVDGRSDPGASGSNPLSYLYRVRFNVPIDAIEPKMTFSLKADNYAQVAINGVSAGGLITGSADQLNVDAIFSQSVLPGENTITLNITDTNGLNGFNFRIDLSMKSAQPLEIVPTAQPPVVASGSTSGTYGTAFSYNISATNSPTSYGATGLPPGLTRSGAVISGTPTQAGTFTVGLSATNAGGTGQGTLTITIGKKSATVELADLNHTYDGTAKSATATTTPAGLGVTFNSGNNFTNAGTYPVIASINDANYTGSTSDHLVIAKAPSTLTTVGAGPFTYDGTTHAGGSGTVTGAGVITGTATVSYAGDRVNAGSYTVTAHYAGDANHKPSDGSPVTVTINKATATVVVAPYSVTYNGQPHSATVASITGVNGETGATVGAVTLNTTHTNAGTYADSWSFTGAANYNNIASKPITNSIAKATATVVVTPYNVTYNGQPRSATVASITGVNGETGVTVGAVTLNTTHTNAGSYADSWSFAGAANYNPIASTPITNTIAKATATVVVTPYNVEYDAQPHSATVTSITGANGETGATVGAVNLNTTHTAVGVYSDTWSFTGAINYNNIGATPITNVIKDTTAPVITSLTASSGSLWPANHKMVAITLSAVATDLVGVTSLKIIGATSNEPDNGLGDGDTAGDIVITGNLTLNLRAERGGGGNGRIYTITVEAKDAAGNASTRLVTVSVPKSQGK